MGEMLSTRCIKTHLLGMASPPWYQPRVQYMFGTSAPQGLQYWMQNRHTESFSEKVTARRGMWHMQPWTIRKDPVGGI